MARIDLHLHTRYSDDNLTPAEVVDLAHQAGITAIAITGHDIVGYFFDWQDSTFRDHLAQQRRSRHVRNPQTIARLNALGLELSEEEVLVTGGSDFHERQTRAFKWDEAREISKSRTRSWSLCDGPTDRGPDTR
jgi:predicted metal-dependent phosphoesterase TrpH